MSDPASLPGIAGRVALVTGGSRGLGAGIAVALAGAGADVAVNYVSDEASAQRVVERVRALGRRALAVRADVSRADQVAMLMDAVGSELGVPLVLVNNAGIMRQRAVDALTEADFDEHIAVNLKSAFLVTQAALPAMRAARFGRIVMMSSAAAQTGGRVGVHYAASKAGMLGLMHGYAQALAGEGITVNAIAPALISVTDGASATRTAANPAFIPVKRFGTVEECAALTLAALGNGYLTGQTLSLNGGLVMTS
ncbi:MAG: SDR family NAD(P)-dependent oxidoreductase [Burkholderiales bacterium]|nr:SDR family NAD(P)-dependent oxidoreductase [Burkholderiales bacterium]